MLNATRTARTHTKRPANPGLLFCKNSQISTRPVITRPGLRCYAACPSLERALI